MESHVDPFLVEALEDPRHRLTVLRMEFDIQKFMQNSDQHQFEFQQLQTSYLRRIAHRVAQHYGLHTFSLDNAIDGSGTVGSKVIARKTPECKFPAVCLSAIPAKQTENRITDQVNITVRKRPSKSLTDRTELENRRSPVRTVEERKEEYEKARARIFNGSCSTDVEGSFSMTSADGRSFWSGRDELECYVGTAHENEKARDAASRVAIFRDREKDRWDPDYDRSYNRYVRNLMPSQNPGLSPCNVLQPPFVQYDTCSQPDFSQGYCLPHAVAHPCYGLYTVLWAFQACHLSGSSLPTVSDI